MNFQCVYDTRTHLSTIAPCNVFQTDSATVKCTILTLANLSHSDQYLDCLQYNNSIEIFSIEKREVKNNTDLCHYKASYKNGSTKSITLCDTELCKPIQMDCTFNSSSECNENRRLWIVIYGILVALINMSFTISYRLFDIIVVDLTREHNNDFGRQRVWSILGGVSGPPIAGFLLHMIDITGNEKRYTVAFITTIAFVLFSALSLWQVKTTLYKPSAKMWRKALVLGKKLEVWLFVLLLIVMGSCYGFRAIYGSWYLQGIGATDLLLGVSRGMSDVYGLPFLYSSEWWINKIGYRAIFIPALLGTAVDCFSFSFLEVPWPAVIIESTLILSYHLYWVAVMQYVICIAPEGLQATVRALAGSLQYNLSKLISTTVGGYLMSEYGGRVAFRVLGSIALIYAIVYGSYLRMDHLRKKEKDNSIRIK
ncbi:hypothetical protein TNIN_162541 [Trichonephila inaurata madagascariensis]|uniref:Major facilitator superfamily associated domain-containing protein n=1 Tax=Trichonephila inaurata madagascariensis TaxID=2747483 RepID=A0A8X6XGY3_9ARAC|nr:hypothetical protein TNIN_162541 [Trichonephila inaurata madagascariensis]